MKERVPALRMNLSPIVDWVDPDLTTGTPDLHFYKQCMYNFRFFV